MAALTFAVVVRANIDPGDIAARVNPVAPTISKISPEFAGLISVRGFCFSGASFHRGPPGAPERRSQRFPHNLPLAASERLPSYDVGSPPALFA